MKKLLLSSVFIVLALIIVTSIADVCRHKSRHRQLFSEPADGIDLVILGSSHADRTWNPLVFYCNFGVCSLVYGTPCQPSWITYEYLKYALEKHRPKVVLFECFSLARTSENIHSDGDIRAAIECIPSLIRQWSCIERMYPEEDLESRYFDLLKYHTRWTELEKSDYVAPKGINLHGHLAVAKFVEKPFQTKANSIDPTVLLSQNAKDWLEKILELVKSHNAELAIFSAPYNIDNCEFSLVCDTARWCAEHNVPFLNLSNVTLINQANPAERLIPERDFYDIGHVNINGAEIVTRHVGKWIQGIYNLPKSTNAVICANWDRDLADYDRKYGPLMFKSSTVINQLISGRADYSGE